MSRNVYLVTGGAGFIGSNYIHYLFEKYAQVKVINLDKLTYAGNPENLNDLKNNPDYVFIKGDICDSTIVNRIFEEFKPDYLINFAAESHVDRSIGDAEDFIRTDMYGVYVLLEATRKYGLERFIQISTDEVYGSIESGSFTEESPLKPGNPYSASKAGGDRLTYSYFNTYQLPVIITRASNNYGPYQYPEKLIPLFVTNAMEDKSLPLYGDGKNVRDWLYVKDHCKAIEFVLKNGELGEVYNIAGGSEKENIEITRLILELMDKPESLIKPVADRIGHDRRYSLDSSKLHQLGWQPQHSFDVAMRETVQWYVDHQDWWKPLKSGEYLEYYKKHYPEGKSLT
ncbi:MAG: dTDP-glucose 4,6-dehydratase [Candidatus Marinimicrobia bacterium]|nr:dTDP-glucose 4,6-dehydratase [bacterium]MCG2715781.1 dTDP-glucose 4,6-dehydratase [Candidatus Neomarinimicrobiota bacterium]